MNKFIIINVKDNIKMFLNKCNKYKLELHNIVYLNSDEIRVKIREEDYKLIKRYNYYCDINIYSKMGIDKIKEKIFGLKYFILVFIICLIGMYFVSNIILDVNVIHSNKKIRELVLEELESNGINKYSYKKKFNELEIIKNTILENNKDKIEWLSITNKGMKYVVRVEERILDKISNEDNYCNIVSLKEALITNIYGIKGEILVNVNDIVREGDVLISGNIVLNEETKGTLCANGIVRGKVWYNTNINLDREYYEKKYTGKKRFNIILNYKVLRKNKYVNYDKKYLIKTKLFSIYKEIEYKNIKKKYNESESLEKALLEVDNKFKSKLGSDGNIVSKKVLNKSLSDKNIYLDVFVVTEEVISKKVKVEDIIIDNK